MVSIEGCKSGRKHHNARTVNRYVRLQSCKNFLLFGNQFLRRRNRFRSVPVKVKKEWHYEEAMKKERKSCCEDWKYTRRCDILLPRTIDRFGISAWRNDRHSSSVVNLDCSISFSFPLHKILIDLSFTFFLRVEP